MFTNTSQLRSNWVTMRHNTILLPKLRLCLVQKTDKIMKIATTRKFNWYLIGGSSIQRMSNIVEGYVDIISNPISVS